MDLLLVSVKTPHLAHDMSIQHMLLTDQGGASHINKCNSMREVSLPGLAGECFLPSD